MQLSFARGGSGHRPQSHLTLAARGALPRQRGGSAMPAQGMAAPERSAGEATGLDRVQTLIIAPPMRSERRGRGNGVNGKDGFAAVAAIPGGVGLGGQVSGREGVAVFSPPCGSRGPRGTC
jgi:hypothetical protein